MRPQRLLSVWVGLLLAGGLLWAQGGPEFSPAFCANGALTLEQGIPVLQLAGSPEEIGRAHGTLLGAEVRYLRASYLERVIPVGPLKQLALKLARPMERHIPTRYLQELKSLAEAAEESRENVFLIATFLDVYRMMGCSAFLAIPPAAEEPLLARNLDFPTLGVAHRYSLVAVYHPEGERAFLSVTWPGLPGVVSGMNEAGLVLVMLEVSDLDESLEGIPYQLLYRSVLEECSTVDEAEALIRAAPRTTANNVLLLDRADGAAVLEVTRSAVGRRGPEGGVLWATNHFRLRGPVGSFPYGWCDRYDALGRELIPRRGRLNVPQAAELLAMVHQGSLTMQSMVFEPRSLRLHVAFGEPPTTARPYVTVDAARLFRWQPTAAEPSEEGLR